MAHQPKEEALAEHPGSGPSSLVRFFYGSWFELRCVQRLAPQTGGPPSTAVLQACVLYMGGCRMYLGLIFLCV